MAFLAQQKSDPTYRKQTKRKFVLFGTQKERWGVVLLGLK